MKEQEKSIFNLIEIFRKPRIIGVKSISVKEHCDQKGLHDFYCSSHQSI